MKRLIIIISFLVLTNQISAQTATTSISILDSLIVLPTIPSISGNSVVFVDYRNFLYSIYKVDINTKQEQILLFNSGYTEPQIRLSGNRFVWVGYPTITQADVYYRNISTNTTTRLTQDAAYQNYPDIHKNRIVWQDYRNVPLTNQHNADIYLYDIFSGQTQQITTDTSYQTFPAVWDNLIVWEDHRNAHTDTTNADIYMYNLSTNQEIQITSNPAAQLFPDIWEDKIVWEDYRNGVGDIFMYDLSTNTEREICVTPSHKANPVIFRDWIVWQDYRNGWTADIYGFNLVTNLEYLIFMHPDHQDFCQIDSLFLVWQDFRKNRQDLYIAELNNFTGTSTENNNIQIANFILEQNYPNPFNSSSVIKYSIPKSSQVSLKIFNTLGEELETLVNEEKDVGTYELNWGAANLPSGVYFYQLKAGEFVQTKKMILMK
jgi:beta propeller repeat protein